MSRRRNPTLETCGYSAGKPRPRLLVARFVHVFVQRKEEAILDEKVGPRGKGDPLDLIENHPILDFRHGERVHFIFDGKELEGFEGEPISMALHANGVRIYRETAEKHRARGFFCAIGKCSSCFMVVDGVPNVRTCITPLKAGMVVETQLGKGVVPYLNEGGARS